jgi:ketosteroid isomerase-like protein
MRFSLLLLVFALISLFSYAQDRSKDEQEILALENELSKNYATSNHQAMVDYNKRVVTDDFLGTGTNGKTFDKKTAVAQWERMAAEVPSKKFDTYKQEDMKVRVYGNGAVVTGKLMIRGEEQAKAGAPIREERFTHFFEKKDGSWKMAGAQWTIIRNEEQNIKTSK